MGPVFGVIAAAVGAFVGTNVDDFVLLLLLILGLRQDGLRWRQVVLGQYLGFVVLLVVSLAGAAGLRAVPGGWVHLLGILPLALGVRGFFQAARKPAGEEEKPIVAAGAFTVATITVTNGGDNISVYLPLFRQLDFTQSAVTIAVFLILLAVWCGVALLAGRHVKLIPGVLRIGRWLTPSVFCVIGAVLLIRGGLF